MYVKSDCTINLVERKGENYVLSATLDEWISFRMKKNMSGFMLWKEKVCFIRYDEKSNLLIFQYECYGSVKTISDRINGRDPDMMSHVIMSVFKVASAEANVPGPPTTSPSVMAGISSLHNTDRSVHYLAAFLFLSVYLCLTEE